MYVYFMYLKQIDINFKVNCFLMEISTVTTVLLYLL